MTKPNGRADLGFRADEMIMESTEPSATVGELVDRLAAEFPQRPRQELEQAVGEAWSLFSDTHEDVALRATATEWYVRDQLSPAEGH